MNINTFMPVAIACLLIVLDFISGLLKACKQRDLSSGKMREGLYHKSAFVFALILAVVIEHAQHYVDLGFTVPLIMPVSVYVSLTEIVSIIENLAEVNPELANSKLLAFFKTQD